MIQSNGQEVFKVEHWVPKQKKDDGSLITQEMSDIDKLEQAYYEEYQKVLLKDKEKNKDFNVLAYDELKQAKYHFEYLRTQEKLYKYELTKNTSNDPIYEPQSSTNPVMNEDQRRKQLQLNLAR